MCRSGLFKLFRNKFEKKFLKYETSEKTNIRNLDLGQKEAISFFFQKMRARAGRGSFFLDATEIFEN